MSNNSLVVRGCIESFAEENEISCYSTYEKQHGHRRAHIRKYNQNAN